MPTHTSTAVYLYCVVRAPRPPAVARVPRGLPGATRPAPHALGKLLWLITADVPLDVYGADVLEPRLRDLEWVSQAAIAHEAVVEHFARATGAVVIPAKLFTMFSSLKRALDEIGDRRTSIERAMKHISGSEEWGVRVSRIRQTPPVQAGLPSRPASGAAFLAARKSARDASASLRAAAGAAADDAFVRLGRHAKDVRRREARQEPGANPPILEAAFHGPARARARFKAEARRQVVACQAAGAELTLTGPWPAYNFIGSEVSS